MILMVPGVKWTISNIESRNQQQNLAYIKIPLTTFLWIIRWVKTILNAMSPSDLTNQTIGVEQIQYAKAMSMYSAVFRTI